MKPNKSNQKAKIYLHRDTEQSIIDYGSKWRKETILTTQPSDIVSVKSNGDIKSMGGSSMYSTSLISCTSTQMLR